MKAAKEKGRFSLCEKTVCLLLTVSLILLAGMILNYLFFASGGGDPLAGGDLVEMYPEETPKFKGGDLNEVESKAFDNLSAVWNVEDKNASDKMEAQSEVDILEHIDQKEEDFYEKFYGKKNNPEEASRNIRRLDKLKNDYIGAKGSFIDFPKDYLLVDCWGNVISREELERLYQALLRRRRKMGRPGEAEDVDIDMKSICREIQSQREEAGLERFSEISEKEEEKETVEENEYEIFNGDVGNEVPVAKLKESESNEEEFRFNDEDVDDKKTGSDSKGAKEGEEIDDEGDEKRDGIEGNKEEERDGNEENKEEKTQEEENHVDFNEPENFEENTKDNDKDLNSEKTDKNAPGDEVVPTQRTTFLQKMKNDFLLMTQNVKKSFNKMIGAISFAFNWTFNIFKIIITWTYNSIKFLLNLIFQKTYDFLHAIITSPIKAYNWIFSKPTQKPTNKRSEKSEKIDEKSKKQLKPTKPQKSNLVEDIGKDTEDSEKTVGEHNMVIKPDKNAVSKDDATQGQEGVELEEKETSAFKPYSVVETFRNIGAWTLRKVYFVLTPWNWFSFDFGLFSKIKIAFFKLKNLWSGLLDGVWKLVFSGPRWFISQAKGALNWGLNGISFVFEKTWSWSKTFFDLCLKNPFMWAFQRSKILGSFTLKIIKFVFIDIPLIIWNFLYNLFSWPFAHKSKSDLINIKIPANDESPKSSANIEQLSPKSQENTETIIIPETPIEEETQEEPKDSKIFVPVEKKRNDGSSYSFKPTKEDFDKTGLSFERLGKGDDVHYPEISELKENLGKYDPHDKIQKWGGSGLGSNDDAMMKVIGYCSFVDGSNKEDVAPELKDQIGVNGNIQKLIKKYFDTKAKMNQKKDQLEEARNQVKKSEKELNDLEEVKDRIEEEKDHHDQKLQKIQDDKKDLEDKLNEINQKILKEEELYVDGDGKEVVRLRKQIKNAQIDNDKLGDELKNVQELLDKLEDLADKRDNEKEDRLAQAVDKLEQMIDKETEEKEKLDKDKDEEERILDTLRKKSKINLIDLQKLKDYKEIYLLVKKIENQYEEKDESLKEVKDDFKQHLKKLKKIWSNSQKIEDVEWEEELFKEILRDPESQEKLFYDLYNPLKESLAKLQQSTEMWDLEKFDSAIAQLEEKKKKNEEEIERRNENLKQINSRRKIMEANLDKWGKQYDRNKRELFDSRDHWSHLVEELENTRKREKDLLNDIEHNRSLITDSKQRIREIIDDVKQTKGNLDNEKQKIIKSLKKLRKQERKGMQIKAEIDKEFGGINRDYDQKRSDFNKRKQSFKDLEEKKGLMVGSLRSIIGSVKSTFFSMMFGS